MVWGWGILWENEGWKNLLLYPSLMRLSDLYIQERATTGPIREVRSSLEILFTVFSIIWGVLWYGIHQKCPIISGTQEFKFLCFFHWLCFTNTKFWLNSMFFFGDQGRDKGMGVGSGRGRSVRMQYIIREPITLYANISDLSLHCLRCLKYNANNEMHQLRRVSAEI